MVLSDEPLTKRLSCRWRHLTVPEWPARVRAAHTVFVRRFHTLYSTYMYMYICTSIYIYIHVYMPHIEYLHVYMLYTHWTCSYSFKFGKCSSGVYSKVARWRKLCRRWVPPEGYWVSGNIFKISVMCTWHAISLLPVTPVQLMKYWQKCAQHTGWLFLHLRLW